MTERSDPAAAAESNNQAASTRYIEMAQHHERKEDLMRRWRLVSHISK